ncbi:hypothetical protein DYB28_011563 [Aphanomyces astaci]|uniref:Carboxypeptidase n=1 Tax=Aphanomyces astaci TaxID=112090 RepID=A0A9X8E9G2_APHAT|nr:hypothetical protein DYB28_011563 [Aphanomyces astaci]
MTKSEASPLVKASTPTPCGFDLCGYRVGKVGACALASLVVGGLIAACIAGSTSQVEPPFCDPNTRHEFGYIKLPHKTNDQYFYSFFESRNDPATDPLVLWLEGGPGSSSTWTLFNVNGPCFIGDDVNSTEPNPHSWTNRANVIWLDQPTGVGFSQGDFQDDDHNEGDVGRNVYEFLQGWLKEHPTFQSRPFFLTGQSYGGHYVPAAAHYIVTRQSATNQTTNTIPINLQGIAIGNGFTDTPVQLPMIVDMVESVKDQYNITLASPAELSQMRRYALVVAHLIEQCQLPNETTSCLDALEMWGERLLAPMTTNPSRNPYDIRQVCDPNCTDYGMAKTGVYLNQPWIQARLGVNKSYSWNNATVAMAFIGDGGKSAVQYMPAVLESGVRVLLYVGDADLMCDYKGNDAWSKALKWSGQAAYNAAEVQDLVVHGNIAGQVRSAGNLAFVRVFNSGHGVPVDQPVVGLALIDRFFNRLALNDVV